MKALDLLTPGESALEVVRHGTPITPHGIVAAADRGDLRVAARTPSGRRLFTRADVLKFAKARCERAERRATRVPAPQVVS
jgi:hypothetical protein